MHLNFDQFRRLGSKIRRGVGVQLERNHYGRKFVQDYRAKNSLPKKIREFLGLTLDIGYGQKRHLIWQEVVRSLSGYRPRDAREEDIRPYLGEAALRIEETVSWVESLIAGRYVPEAFELIEIGSNPYLMSQLLKQRCKKMDHRSVNYFSPAIAAGTWQEQEAVGEGGHLHRFRYFHADVEKDPLRELGSADVVLFCEVLEHLPYDPAWALYNVVRQLRPGGYLVLTTPNQARFESISRSASHSGSNDDPISGYGIHGRHNREYTMTELLDLVEGMGLTVTRTRTLEVTPHPYMKSIEDRGYGQYLMLQAKLNGHPVLRRPEWLYRSFGPGALEAQSSLVGLSP